MKNKNLIDDKNGNKNTNYRRQNDQETDFIDDNYIKQNEYLSEVER